MNFRRVRLKYALLFSFVIPALLLNSVGVVILNLVKHLHVTMGDASWLEAFKDGTIIVTSFIFASFIPKIGYKKSLIIGIICEILGCFLMAIFPSFFTSHIFFMLSGLGFAFVKIAVYSAIDLISPDDNTHASVITFFEGVFMLGVLSGFWIYGYFMSLGNWITTFWFLGGLSVINLIVILFTKIDERKIERVKNSEFKTEFFKMLGLFKYFIIWSFIILAFVYVFIEQGLTTWLPTFNNMVLHIKGSKSVEITSFFALGIAVGRLVTALLVKKFKWIIVVFTKLMIGFVILILAIYFAHFSSLRTVLIKSWSNVPWYAYLLPSLGFFIGGIYPTICSGILRSQSVEHQSVVTGIIVVFSGLGGTLGSRIVGWMFQYCGGIKAMMIPLIPMVIIAIFIIPYYRLLHANSNEKLK